MGGDAQEGLENGVQALQRPILLAKTPKTRIVQGFTLGKGAADPGR